VQSVTHDPSGKHSSAQYRSPHHAKQQASEQLFAPPKANTRSGTTNTLQTKSTTPRMLKNHAHIALSLFIGKLLLVKKNRTLARQEQAIYLHLV
jgi:hypothetical protein